MRFEARIVFSIREIVRDDYSLSCVHKNLFFVELYNYLLSQIYDLITVTSYKNKA